MAVVVLDEPKMSQTSNGKGIHEIAFGPFDFQETSFFVHANNTHIKTKIFYMHHFFFCNM